LRLLDEAHQCQAVPKMRTSSSWPAANSADEALCSFADLGAEHACFPPSSAQAFRNWDRGVPIGLRYPFGPGRRTTGSEEHHGADHIDSPAKLLTDRPARQRAIVRILSRQYDDAGRCSGSTTATTCATGGARSIGDRVAYCEPIDVQSSAMSTTSCLAGRCVPRRALAVPRAFSRGVRRRDHVSGQEIFFFFLSRLRDDRATTFRPQVLARRTILRRRARRKRPHGLSRQPRKPCQNCLAARIVATP